MDPFSIANGALSFAQVAFSAAESMFGTPAWEKYVLAGISICQKAIPIIQDAVENPAKYDSMTAADIQKLLAPASWDDLMAAAKIAEAAA